MEKNSSTWFSQEACVGGVVQEDPGMVVEERLDLRGEVGRKVVDDAVQLHAGGGLVIEVGQEGDEVLGASRVRDPGGDVALVPVEPGEEHRGAVAAVLELLRTATPGRAGRVGLMRLLAWMPDFSSTDQTTALSGGLR